MNFDGDIKVHGRTDVSALKENLNTLDFGSYKDDQALRHRLAPGRKGRAIWVLRPYLIGNKKIQFSPNSYFELKRRIHCHTKYEGTDLFEKFLMLLILA